MGKRRVDQVSSEKCGDERNPQTKRFKLSILESQLETIYERDNEAESSDDSSMNRIEKFEESRFLGNLLLVSRPANEKSVEQRKKVLADNLDMGRRLSGLMLTAAAHG